MEVGESAWRWVGLSEGGRRWVKVGGAGWSSVFHGLQCILLIVFFVLWSTVKS